jgi:hypothetical protein
MGVSYVEKKNFSSIRLAFLAVLPQLETHGVNVRRSGCLSLNGLEQFGVARAFKILVFHP